MIEGTSTRKRYTRPFTTPSALSGVPMATLPSRSLTQPGPPVVAPPARAPSVGSAMTAGPYGGGALSYGGGGAPAGSGNQGTDYGLSAAQASAGIGQQQPTSEASPYERYYYEDIAAQRGIEAGREGEAGRLTTESEGYLTPQAWAHAGPDASYWKGEAARQLSAVNQQYNDDKAKIQWRFDAGQINEAQRRIELDRLDRDVAGKRAAAQSAVQSQRMTTGLAAAQDTAKSYAGLAGQVPRDRIAVSEPTRIGLEEPAGVGGGGGGGKGSGMSNLGFEQTVKFLKNKYGSWTNTPGPVQKATLDRFNRIPSRITATNYTPPVA